VHASDFKVVLTGEGADEILGGYDIFKEAKVRRFLAAQPDSEQRAALFGRLYPYLPHLQNQSVAMRRAFFRTRGEDLESPFFSHLPRWGMSAQLRRFLTPEFSRADVDGDHADLRGWLPASFAQWKPFCQAQFLEAALLMPGYILSTQGDRMAMAHSVEGRFPFLDHRVAEFAATVPPRLKMMGLNEKYLLKRAFRDRIPDQVLQRSKQPYRAPDAKSFFTHDWQSTRADYVAHLLSPERLAAAGVFQPSAVAGLLHKARQGKATGTRDNMALVAILSTQILIDTFIDNFPHRVPAAGTLLDTQWKPQPDQQTLTT
jgi:asparagine synthase (glutamine-hydrolysing)